MSKTRILVKDTEGKGYDSYDMSELAKLSKLYDFLCIKEYLADNNEWTEEKLNFIARRANELFRDIERGDEEAACIEQAKKEWGDFNA